MPHYFKQIDGLVDTEVGYANGTTDNPTYNDVFAQEQKHIQGKIAVENLPLKNFYKVEDYHQDYLDKNPDGYCHLPQSLFEFARKAKNNHADKQ